MTPDDLRDRIRDVPDFPKPGILFKDINPLLADHKVFSGLVEGLCAPFVGKAQKVAGIEARGLILAAPMAHRLGAGFVPVRKAGKLPGEVYTESYDLEYGQAVLQLQQDAFEPGDRVLLVDDVMATGGTLQAALRLLDRAGAVPIGIAVLLDLGIATDRGWLAGTELYSLIVP